jgi:uncharacterized protein YndB with AHSA1/START domain
MATKNQTTIKAEPGKQEFFIHREFEAPRELVFKAFTDPELLAQWLGISDFTCKVDQFEPGSGGKWRFIHAGKDGTEYGFHGVCHEETMPERIIQTFEFEGLKEESYVVLQTARFESLPGKRTRALFQSVFQSVANRDHMLRSGMEKGMNDSHERLDELFEKQLAN